ncbi:hypothetical protein BH10PSE12_BH10PSE12_07830 [soil metagenome]
MAEVEQPDLAALTVQLLSAYVANNSVASEDLAGLIASTRAALSGEAKAEAPAAPDYSPAVTARKSLGSRDHILSMIDGKPYKTLKRHLATHGLTPAEYRTRYGLPKDYPMVAPGYSEQRRAVAQRLGLGRRPKVAAVDVAQEAAAPADTPPTDDAPAPAAAAPKTRGRKPQVKPADTAQTKRRVKKAAPTAAQAIDAQASPPPAAATDVDTAAASQPAVALEVASPDAPVAKKPGRKAQAKAGPAAAPKPRGRKPASPAEASPPPSDTDAIETPALDGEPELKSASSEGKPPRKTSAKTPSAKAKAPRRAKGTAAPTG